MSIAAIYGRKSLFTGKGESIKNQIDSCREYALRKGWDFIEYFDEGFSGKDIDRPGFHKLLNDIEKGNIHHVIFYKLDRISRRMLDILDFIEKTNEKGIDFISITENFDTTTPLGRAMVHIAATFAQLEREMLQQRVQDNMLRLAKTGRWLGGITPTGFISQQEKYIDSNGKEKIKYGLKGIDEEINLVKLIYQKYLLYKSLSQVEKYLLKQDIRTKNETSFKKQTIRAILTNPVYIKADPMAYQYFANLHIDIANPIEDFDGTHGILTYNKNVKKKGKASELRDPTEWILALGTHEGIIESKDWIQVQNLLLHNKEKGPRQLRSHAALMTSIIKCKDCGSSMKIKYGQKDGISGKRFYYYVCQTKDLSEGKQCSCSNIRGDVLDNLVMENLATIQIDKDRIQKSIFDIHKRTSKKMTNNYSIIEEIKTEIKTKEESISQLIKHMEKNLSSTVAKHAARRIKELDDEIKTLSIKLQEISSHPKQLTFTDDSLKIIADHLLHFDKLITNIEDINLKRMLVSTIFEKALWSHGKLEILLHGSKNS